MTARPVQQVGRDAVPSMQRSGGFSLIEICLAILIFATGILTIFALIPEGLRQSKSAVEDTHMALFAQTIMSGIRANGSVITNWSDWNSNFVNLVLPDFPLDELGSPIDAVQGLQTFDFPQSSGVESSAIRCDLTFGGSGARREVILHIDTGRFGPMNTNVFYTELYYMGNPGDAG